jgi:hypothetical protein
MEAPDNVHRDLRTSFTRAFYTLRYIIQHLPHLRSQFIYLKLEIHEAFVLNDQETVKKYEISRYLSDIVAITDTAYTWRSMRKGIWGTVPTDANVRCVRQLISFGNKFSSAYTTSVLPLHICDESLRIRSHSEEFLSKKHAVGVTYFEMAAVPG